MPCRPSGSWSTAITSALRSTLSVFVDGLMMLVPISIGAAMIAHRLKWVRSSLSVRLPLPTCNMSGSFQCPGPAKRARSSLKWVMLIMLVQLALMSPVVRHMLPTSAPHSHTFGGPVRPHSTMLYRIGRPVLRSASRMALYRVCASTPWLLQLSYFR